MAFCSRFSYQKLKKLATTTEQHEEEEEGEEHVRAHQQSIRIQEPSAAASSKSWLRPRRRRPWRRPRVRFRIAGFGRLVRRKARAVRGAVRKVVNRIKEGSPYIGGLFAGNYMFMHVSPSPGPTVPVESFLTSAAAAAGSHFYSSAMVPARTARAVSLES